MAFAVHCIAAAANWPVFSTDQSIDEVIKASSRQHRPLQAPLRPTPPPQHPVRIATANPWLQGIGSMENVASPLNRQTHKRHSRSTFQVPLYASFKDLLDPLVAKEILHVPSKALGDIEGRLQHRSLP